MANRKLDRLIADLTANGGDVQSVDVIVRRLLRVGAIQDKSISTAIVNINYPFILQQERNRSRAVLLLAEIADCSESQVYSILSNVGRKKRPAKLITGRKVGE